MSMNNPLEFEALSLYLAAVRELVEKFARAPGRTWSESDYMCGGLGRSTLS